METTVSNKVLTIDSREVAEMLEIRHNDLLRKIEGSKNRVGIIQVITERQMSLSDFFIESSYKDSTGKENKSYLVTKKGCEVLANKMTGEKGILFTLKYVNKFNDMEQQLQQLNQPSYMIEDSIARAERWIEEEKERRRLQENNDKLLEENKSLEEKIDNITTHSLTIEDSRKVIVKIVRTIAYKKYNNCVPEAWKVFYSYINTKLGINVRARKKARKTSSLIGTLSESELYKAEEIARQWASNEEIDLTDIVSLKEDK